MFDNNIVDFTPSQPNYISTWCSTLELTYRVDYIPLLWDEQQFSGVQDAGPHSTWAEGPTWEHCQHVWLGVRRWNLLLPSHRFSYSPLQFMKRRSIVPNTINPWYNANNCWHFILHYVPYWRSQNVLSPFCCSLPYRLSDLLCLHCVRGKL